MILSSDEAARVLGIAVGNTLVTVVRQQAFGLLVSPTVKERGIVVVIGWRVDVTIRADGEACDRVTMDCVRAFKSLGTAEEQPYA